MLFCLCDLLSVDVSIGGGPTSTGYQKVIIDPFFTEDLEWVSGSFDSPNGCIEVAWKRKGTKVEVTVRAEKAEILLPPGLKNIQWNVNGRSE